MAMTIKTFTRFSGGMAYLAGLQKQSLSLCLLVAFAALGGSAQQASPTPGPPRIGVQDYDPITAGGRAKWFAVSTARGAVTGSVFSAAWGTSIGRPDEYPNNWEGFGRRYRQSMAGVITGNAIEASVGALWGEDPRYFPTNLPMRGNLGTKVKHVITSTFTATNRRGERMPSYAFFIAQPANNFLANAWRVESESTVGAALLRTSFGVLGRMTSNAFAEFRPSLMPGQKDPDPATPRNSNPPTPPAP